MFLLFNLCAKYCMYYETIFILKARPIMRLLAGLYLGVFKVCDNVLHGEVHVSEVKYFQSQSYHSTVILTFN